MAQYSTVLYIVRHGERIDNVDPYWTKSAKDPYDPPLTENGLAQAETTGIFISGNNLTSSDTLPIRHVFTSPFLRCVQTANEIVSALPLSQAFPIVSSLHSISPTITTTVPTSTKNQIFPPKVSHNNSHSVSVTNLSLLANFLNPAPGTRKRNRSAVNPVDKPTSLSPPGLSDEAITRFRSPSNISPVVNTSNANTSSSRWQNLPLGLISFSIDNGLCEWLSSYYFAKPCPSIDPLVRKRAFPNLTTESDLIGLRALALGSVSHLSYSFSPSIPMSLYWPRYPESGHAMESRFVSTVTRLVEKYGWNSSLVLVTHGTGVAAIVQGLVPGSDVYEADYCCVTKLVRNRGEFKWKVELLADNTHIKMMEMEKSKRKNIPQFTKPILEGNEPSSEF
ncbi:hypothetical protein HK096_006961 [Nowakowskiella sp. JEL0078]|nr:hypothetical protein HK096_006961 [Nowakowskiella sp. JEL0078]